MPFITGEATIGAGNKLKPKPFEGKWALVTGASSGIGRAIAFELASRQANLILVSRSQAALDSVKQQIETNYQNQTLVYVSDLSKPEAAQDIEQFCQKNDITVTVLVNNAGVAVKTEDEIKNPTLVSDMLRILVGNLTELSLRFLPGMIRQSEGYVLNIGSIVALVPVASTMTYHAAKAYVLAFTRALHWEYSKKGIHITCSLPGATKTGFSSASGLYVPAFLWKRYGSAEMVAKDSIKALLQNRWMVIPGWSNRGLYWLSRLLPHHWIYQGQKKYWTRYRRV